MNNSVQISEGVYFGDDDARRIAGHMLDDLRRVDEQVTAMLKAAKGSASWANPIGQQRWYKRFMKVIGPVTLQAGLTTGKRGRFKLVATRWYVTGEGRLVVSVMMLIGNGIRAAPTVGGADMLEFSMHALQRMIQRAGIRQASDYLPFLRELALPVLALSFAERAVRRIDDDETWPLPVTCNGLPTLLLIRNRRCEDGSRVPLVATVYKGAWRDIPVVRSLQSTIADRFRKQNEYATEDEMTRLDREVFSAFIAAAQQFREVIHV